MDELKKRLMVDRALILIGGLGAIGGIVAVILSLEGYFDLDVTWLVFAGICIYFCVRGIWLLGQDKEKFDMANQPEGQYREDHTGESKYQTGKKKKKKK